VSKVLPFRNIQKTQICFIRKTSNAVVQTLLSLRSGKGRARDIDVNYFTPTQIQFRMSSRANYSSFPSISQNFFTINIYILDVSLHQVYGKQVYRYWTREIIALQRSNKIKILPMSWAHTEGLQKE